MVYIIYASTEVVPDLKRRKYDDARCGSEQQAIEYNNQLDIKDLLVASVLS